MAYDEYLAERIARSLKKLGSSFEEKKMFGGVAFMVKDKMCVGIIKESLMVRIGPDQHDAALKKKGCRVMDFTGRPMKGLVIVDPEGIDKDKDLDYWVALALEYNKIAKSSKKTSAKKVSKKK
jgi:TfoX/Sxy family transcriptional regulator of competence genes